MQCALVFYLVATIFVIVHSESELCDINYHTWETGASCESFNVPYVFDFIPPISQNITYIDMQGQPLKQLPYNAFRNLSSQRTLSKIYLRRCQISHVDAGALLNLHKLMMIALSYNSIKQIDAKLFRDTRELKYIYLGNNQIEVLPSGVFQNLVLLEQIVLHENRIHQVERFSFKNTPALWTIDLGNNQIESMNMSFKDEFDKLTSLWLDNNPWKCDCKLGPLYEFLLRVDHLDQNWLECEKPARLQGSHWEDVSRDTFVCSSADATTTWDSVISGTESSVTKGDTAQAINKDAERVNIEVESSTTSEIRKTESSDKQDVTVEEETNSCDISELVTAQSAPEAEESSKTPQEPVSTTTEISFNNHEGADTNCQPVSNDFKWLPWTLCSVAIVCLLGCAARYTFTHYRRRRIPSVRRTEQPTEDTSELLDSQTAEQADC